MSSTFRTVPPEQPAGTYSVTQLEALEQASHGASTKHLMAAADWASVLFQANKIQYAFMGGFSLKIRGSSRDTYDVDIAIGCDMLRLIQVLTPQSRVLRPLGPVSGVMRTFVKIGGEYNADIHELFVEVDLILEGSLGAPDHLESMSEDVSIATSSGLKQYRLLNLKGIMAAKLGAAFARSSRNDFDDILYLISKYPQQLWGMKQDLSNEHRQHFINNLYLRSAEKSAIIKAQQILGVAGHVPL